MVKPGGLLRSKSVSPNSISPIDLTPGASASGLEDVEAADEGTFDMATIAGGLMLWIAIWTALPA